MAAAKPDVIVSTTSEHITNSLSTNAPAFCVGIGGVNPSLPEFGLPDVQVPGDAEFARGLVEFAYDRGFDLAHASRLVLDYGTNLPLSYITPEYNVPVVPIMINTIWAPLPTAERSYQLGELIADYVAADKADKRVLLMGTGGISHWVGSQRHGDLNQEFDMWFLKEVSSGSGDNLRKLSQADIDVAGDGGNEIRNWIRASCRVPAWSFTAASRATTESCRSQRVTPFCVG